MGAESLSERIKLAESDLSSLQDELADAVQKEAETPDDEAALLVVKDLTERVEKGKERLVTLKSAERQLMAGAVPVQGGGPAPVGRSGQGSGTLPTSQAPALLHWRDGQGAPVKNRAELLFRAGLCSLEAIQTHRPADEIVERRYGKHADFEATKLIFGLVFKAAQNPAMVSVPDWAGVLVQDTYAAFLDMLRMESIVPRLPLRTYMFDGGDIVIPQRAARTPNLAAAFRAEGAPIRVGAMSLTSKKLKPKTMGIIGHWTMELQRRTNGAIEDAIREAMIGDTAEKLDEAFLSNQAGSDTQPAGLQTYATGANTRPSTGNTSAQIDTDLTGMGKTMLGAGYGRKPVWIMDSANWMAVQSKRTAVDMPYFDTAGKTLKGWPVVDSISVPNDIVFLIDASELGFAGGTPEFLPSFDATVHEQYEQADVKPIVGGAAGTPEVAQPVRSLWQTYSVGLRAVWEVDWTTQRLGQGMVQTLTGVAW